MSASHEGTEIDRVRRAIGRAGFVFAFTGLSFGTAMFLLHFQDLSGQLFVATFAILLALPAVNVLAVLTEEIRRRDWLFVLLALGVVSLLTYAVIDRLSH
jgi:hypothetical protein